MPNSKDKRTKTNLDSNGSMTFEPLKPGDPAPVDRSVPPPMIVPEPKAGLGWRKAVKPAPATPEDIKRPGYTGVVKI